MKNPKFKQRMGKEKDKFSRVKKQLRANSRIQSKGIYFAERRVQILSSWIHTLARKAAFSSEDEQLGSTPSIEYGEELVSGSSLLLSLQLRMNCRLVEFLGLEKKENLGIEAETRKHSIVSLTLSLPESFFLLRR